MELQYFGSRTAAAPGVSINKTMSNKHLLITGGTGYLGSELVRQAARQGWNITATYHSHTPTAQPGVRWQALDLREPHAIAELCASSRPQVIIHTAYMQSGPDLEQITAYGSAAIAQAASQHGTRLIHMSSDALFDGEQAETERYTEQDVPSPITPYGHAKAQAEAYVKKYCPDALIIRTSLIYGGAQPSPHEELVLSVLKGQNDIAFFTDEIRCPIVVYDLAAALLELTPSQHCGILNIAGADSVSRAEFARLIARANGYDPALLRFARNADQPIKRPRHCALDISLAQGMLKTHLRGVYEYLTPT